MNIFEFLFFEKFLINFIFFENFKIFWVLEKISPPGEKNFLDLYFLFYHNKNI